MNRRDIGLQIAIVGLTVLALMGGPDWPWAGITVGVSVGIAYGMGFSRGRIAPPMSGHDHRFTPWRVERRVLVGPYGRTEDDVLRRRCEIPSCAHIQQKEMESVR